MVILRLLAFVGIIVLSVSSLFAQGGYQGTDFWVAFPQNARAENASGLRFTVYITSPKATSGTITETRTGKATNFTLEPNKAFVYEADSVNQLMENGISNSTFHVTSKNNVTVLCYSSRRASTDSYVAIPTVLVGNTYAAIGYDKLPSESSMFTTQFDIIATKDDTKITVIYPSGKGETDILPKTITLNQGEVYHQNSIGFKQYNYDLTGTIILSNKPVAFLSGNTCAQVPRNNNFCDVLLEMLPPAEVNGKEFIIPAFAQRDRSSIRVVAMENGTKVTLNGSDVAILRAGEFYQNDSIQGTALLKTSENAYVVQYGQSSTASNEQIADPDMIVLSPMGTFAELVDFVVPEALNYSYLSNPLPHDDGYSVDTTSFHPRIALDYNSKRSAANMTVLVVDKENYPLESSPNYAGGWQHWVTLVSKTTDITNITLDGKVVDASSFKQIPKSIYSISHIEVANGNHRVISTTDVAVYSYGYGAGGDNYDSYGHNCGMNLIDTGK
jgi:hypothetical protein